MLWKLIVSFSFFIILFVQDVYVEETTTIETVTDQAENPQETDPAENPQDTEPAENPQESEQTEKPEGETETENPEVQIPEGATDGDDLEGTEQSEKPQEPNEVETSEEGATESPITEQITQGNETIVEENESTGRHTPFIAIDPTESNATSDGDLIPETEALNGTSFSGEEGNVTNTSGTTTDEFNETSQSEEGEDDAKTDTIPDEITYDDQKEGSNVTETEIETEEGENTVTETEEEDLITEVEDLTTEEEDLITEEEDTSSELVPSEEIEETQTTEDEEEKPNNGDDGDINPEWENQGITSTHTYDETLGEHAAKVAFYLRQNLINLFGYLMYQPKVDITREIFFYLHQLKLGLLANKVDIFELIHVLPKLYGKDLNDQFAFILEQMEKIADDKYCHIKCTAGQLRERQCLVDMTMAVGHLKYNPILTGILETAEDVETLERLSKALKKTKSEKNGWIPRVFSKHLVRIISEINKQVALTDQILGYLIPFYPWPVGQFIVEQSVQMVTKALEDPRESLVQYGVDVRKIWAPIPIRTLKKLMIEIYESKSERAEKVSSITLLRTLDNRLTFPDYRNTFQGVYAEINRLWELLDIVDHENYPPEIVMAREHLKLYLDKVVFYLNYPRFIAYKYAKVEETLIAFLDYIMQETPYLYTPLKLSLNALKAYLLFYTGPRKITYDLFLTLIDGLMAADLNNEVLDYMLDVKVFILDEATEIKRALKQHPVEKCTDLIPCYFQILTILKKVPYFQDKMHLMAIDECLLRRYLNDQELPSERQDAYEGTPLEDLLDVIDFRSYTYELVIAAQQIQKYIKDSQSNLHVPVTVAYCTKQETLLHKLESLVANNPKFPNNIAKCINSVIHALKFKLASFDHVSVGIMNLVFKAWSSPFIDKELHAELSRVQTMMTSNERDIDLKLSSMNPHECSGFVECYNGVIEHLNIVDPALTLETRTEISPELFGLDVGELAPMNTQTLIKIIDAVQDDDDENSALEAVKSYLADFQVDIDKVIKDVDCNGKQVINCFSMLLDKMRFSEYLSHVGINIIQFALIPTVCDSSRCRWIPYEEKGTVIINPLLQYMLYLLEHYSANEVKSFHLHMDIFQILDYLNTDDVGDVLPNFKLNSDMDNIEKLSQFLVLLQSSKLVAPPVQLSVKNVYDFITNNALPESINIGNFFYLEKQFAKQTNSSAVHFELNDIIDDIHEHVEEISDVLEKLYVDCFTLEKCVSKIREQITTDAYDPIVIKPILQLLQPESCQNEKKICPWISKGLSITGFVQKHVLPAIQEVVKDPKQPLITKIVWKIIGKKVEKHENFITETIEESDIPGRGIEKLKMFIKKALEYDMPQDLKKYLNEMRAHMNNPLNSFVLDVMILNGVLDYMSKNTLDGVILTDIKETQELALKNQGNINKDIRIVKMSCEKLQNCVQDIFDGLTNKGLNGKNFVKLLLQLLLAKKCSVDDCSWRATNNQKTPTIFKKKLTDMLEELLENDENPYIVRLDVEEILDYFENADDLLENIQEVLVNNDADHADEDDKELLYEILAGLAQKAPANVDASMNSVVDYLKHNGLKSYLLTTNLKRMVEGFISLAENSKIAKIMENGSLYLKGHDEEAAEFLDVSPVNCRTQDSCVKTLYAVCQKEEANEIAQVIMSILKPEECKVKICPWIKPIAGVTNINHLANMINKELTDLQHEKGAVLHIKLDAQAFKKVIMACPECLLKIFGTGIATRSSKPYKNLRLLLQLIDVGTLKKYDMEIVKKDIEGFLTISKLPNILDHPPFLVFAEILKKLSKSEEIRKEIEEQKVKAIYEKKGVRAILLVCSVDCTDVKSCTKSLLACVQSEPTVNNPEAIIIERLVNPKSCNKENCQWIPDIESHEDLMERFEEIKDDVKEKIEDDSVPIIIRIMLNVLLDYLEFTKVEKYLMKITANNPDKLNALLSLIGKDDKDELGYIARIALKVKNYFKTKKVPQYLTYEDFKAIVKWLTGRIEDHPDVQEYLTVALHVISNKQVEIDAVLKNCSVECVELKSCFTTVSKCLESSKTTAAFWILHIIFPEPCDHKICPWLPDKVPNLGEHLPIEKPKTILLDRAILLYVERKKEQFIILDVTKEKTITMLVAYSYLADSNIRRVVVLYAKKKKLVLDFIFLKGIKQAGSKGKLEVDFTKTGTLTICQQFKNGAFRPLKFDLTKAETKKALMNLAIQQESRGRYKNKQMILLKDSALGKHRLYIDVMDPTTMRTILEASIDDVMPEEYQAVFFWPDGTNNPWRSAIIEDGSAIEACLLNLPGMDYAGCETPVVMTFDGFITMDFDIYNREVQDSIESSLETFSAILNAAEHTKFMFYLPFPFRRNMIPFPVDLEDNEVIDLLIRAEKKYLTDHFNVTTVTINLEDRSIPLKFDFFSDIVTYLLEGGPEEEVEGVPDVNWVVFSVSNMRHIVLDLQHDKVRRTLLNKFRKIPVNKKLLVISVKDDNDVSHPVVIDPHNELVIRLLASLSANTLPPTKAFPYNVGEKSIIVCVVETDDGNIAAIFEDIESVRNRLSVYVESESGIDEDAVYLPFSKPIRLTRKAVHSIVRESSIEQDLPSIFFIGTMNDTGEFVIPLSIHGAIHLITIDSTDNEVIKILLKHNKPDVDGPSITFVVVDTHEKMYTITLASDDEILLEALIGVSVAIETQIRSEALMVIVTVDDNLHVKSFILNLDTPKVLNELRKLGNDIDEDSTSKGVFFFTNTQGAVIPIILDNSEYDVKLLEGLEQYTPSEMQPIRIPNIDGKSPLIGFMLKISDNEKISVVLNTLDNVVMRGLQQISKASKGKGIAIKVTDRKGAHHLIHIDGAQKGVRKKLDVMLQRLNPFHTPTMPASIDGTYTLTIKVNENGKTVTKTVNTMDKEDIKELRAQHESLDDTAPVMLVMNPKGEGEELRVDVPKHEDTAVVHSNREVLPDFNLVVMYPNVKEPAIILNLEDMDTADRFEALIEEGDNEDAPYILYIDYSGKVVKYHIDLSDNDLMQELWHLMQETYKPTQQSYQIMPESNKPHIVFTVTNNKGEVVAIILDISKQLVKEELIALWGYSTSQEGIEIKLPHYNKETLIIHINPNVKDTMEKLIEMMNKYTEKIDVPLVIGSSTSGPIIKIPTVEGEKVYLINCNVSDPMVAAKLQKDHGRKVGYKRGTVTVMYLDPRGKLQAVMLDLNDGGVIRSLKKICKKTTAVLNLAGTVVVTTEDPLGNKQTSVVDITNPEVQEKLSQMGHIIVAPEDLDKHPNVLTVPMVDEDETPSEIHIEMDNVEVYELLDKLTELSLGDYSTEQIIPGRQSPYTVVFTVTGPIVIDQTNVGLVDKILSDLNDPDNPNAVKVVFVMDQAVKTVYLDLTDSEKMSKLKEMIDAHFEQTVVAPMLKPQAHFMKIPCVDMQQRPIILSLDLTKSNVVQAFKEIDKQCEKNGKFTLKVNVKKDGKLVGLFAMDTTNPQMCEMLKQTVDGYQYDPPYGSLAIMDLPLKSSPIIILDLANQQVVRGLHKISERVRRKEATHYILHLQRRKGTGKIYKINVHNKQIVKMLLPLAQLTQVPIFPRRVLSPYDKNPILLSTLKMGNGEVKHILLPATNKKVKRALKTFSSIKDKERPVDIHTHPIGKAPEKYVIDIGNDTVIEELMVLTRTLHGVTDAFLNVPLQNPRLHKKIVISLENDQGSEDSYMVATSDMKQYKDLKDAEAEIQKKKPTLVLYFVGHRGLSNAVRTDLDKIFTVEEAKPLKIFNPEHILIISIQDENGHPDWLLINLQNKQVVKALLSINTVTHPTRPYTAVTIKVRDKYKAIRLNLLDSNTVQRLKGISEHTEKPTAPNVVISPFGPKPLFVMTMEEKNGSAEAIVIDLNKNKAIDLLDKASDPDNPNGYSLQIPGKKGKAITVVVDPYDKRCRKALEEAHKLTHAAEAPIPGKIGEKIVIPLPSSGFIVNVDLDTGNTKAIKALLDLSLKQSDDLPDVYLQLYLPDPRGILALCILDITREDIINEVIKILTHTTPPTDKPPISAGPNGVYLVVMAMRLPDGMIQVTIDPNNPKVVDLLKKIHKDMVSADSLTIMKIPLSNGKVLRVYIDIYDPKMREMLDKITDLAKVMLSPAIVIPPGGPNPIFSVIIKVNGKSLVLVIDLNNPKMIEQMQKLPVNSDKDTVRIDFVWPEDERPDTIFIDISNPKVIAAIQPFKDNITVYPVPSKSKQVLLVHEGDGTTWEVNLNEQEVVNRIIAISAKPTTPDVKLWTIEFITPQECKVIVYINFNNSNIRPEIEGDVVAAPQIWNVVVTSTTPHITVLLANVVVYPPHGVYPLVMVKMTKLGVVTWDINDDNVFNALIQVTGNACPSKKCIIIEVPDGTGEGVIIHIDISSNKVFASLVQIPVHEHIAFAIIEDHMLPILYVLYNDNTYEFNLNKPEVIQVLIKISHQSPESYKVIITLPLSVITVYLDLPLVEANLHVYITNTTIPNLTGLQTCETIWTTRPPITIESTTWTGISTGSTTGTEMPGAGSTPEVTEETWEPVTWPSEETDSTSDIWTWTPEILETVTDEQYTEETTEYTETSEEDFTWPTFTTDWYTTETESEETEYETETTDYPYTDTSDMWVTLPPDSYTYITYETSYETDSAYTDTSDYTESTYTYSTYETSYETDSAYTDTSDYTESTYTYSTYETSYETDSAYTDTSDYTEPTYTYSTYETSYETGPMYTDNSDYTESTYTYITYTSYETSYETDPMYTDTSDYTESSYTYSSYETSYETDSGYTDTTEYTDSVYTGETHDEVLPGGINITDSGTASPITYETSYETISGYTDTTDYTDSGYTDTTDYTESTYIYTTYETSYGTDSGYTDNTDYTDSGYPDTTDYTESTYAYITYETSYETDSGYTDTTDYTESTYTYTTYETSYETDSGYTDTTEYTDSVYTGETHDEVLPGGINITDSGTASPITYETSYETVSGYTDTTDYTDSGYTDTTDYTESTYTYTTYETSYETDSGYTDNTDYTDSGYTDTTDYTESTYIYTTYETSYETDSGYTGNTDYTDSGYTDTTDYTESTYIYTTYETSYETDSAYTDNTDYTDSGYTDTTDYTESTYTYTTYETSYETDSRYTDNTDYTDSGYTDTTDYVESTYTYTTYETSYETDSAYTDITDYTDSGYTDTTDYVEPTYTYPTDYTESTYTYTTYETSYETDSVYTDNTDYMESTYTYSTYETSYETSYASDDSIIFSTIDTEPEMETTAWSISSPQGSVGPLTTLPSKPPFTTEEAFTTPNNTWNLNLTITTQIPGGSSLYWVAINVTNYITFEMYTYIFDVSLQIVIKKLTQYVAGLTVAQQILTIVLPLPGGQFTLHINPYDKYTFELFTYLTIASTGNQPIFIAIITPHVWWSFTITDSYNNVITFKVDIANKLVVLKLQLLSSWYISAPNKLGIIIKGTLLDGSTIQIIIDPTCSVTVENLHTIMQISIDGKDRPLKPLPPPDPSQYQQLIEIIIQLPARRTRRIKIIIDVSKEEVWEKFLALNNVYRPGATNYIIKITKDRKKYTIKINLFDRQTLLTLIELSKLSGAQTLSKKDIDTILSSIRLHSYVTVVINDFKESLPVTLDVTDEKVYKLLKKVESKDSKYAMVINFIDSKNKTRKLKLNVNDRQVIQILLAVGIPTTYPRRTPNVRLLTFIFAHIADSYVAVLLDMGNRGTVIFFIELVRKHAPKFGKELTYVEVRDDNGQYVTIGVDFNYRPFLSELARKSQTSQHHRITSDDHPFIVFCLPVKKKYVVLKVRLNFDALEKLRRMEPRTGIVIDVVDEQEKVFIDPRDKKLMHKLMGVPGISFIQSSKPKPTMIIYTVEGEIVSPIYLDLRDTNTLNQLIKMHNRYAANNGQFPLSLIRFINPDRRTEYLLLNIRHQGAISALSKFSIHVGDHTFAKQRMEKIATLTIPRRNGSPLNINLNLADPFVIGELRRMSNDQIPNKNVQRLNFIDAYGNPLTLNLDFTQPNVIRKLTKLHYTF